MKVVFLEPLARQLGMKVEEGAFCIECCGGELAVDDEAMANRLKDLLLAYHGHSDNDLRDSQSIGS